MKKPTTVNFDVMMKNLKVKVVPEVKKEVYLTNLGFKGVLIRSFFLDSRKTRVENKEDY
jgi:hypothetical protein